MEKNVLFTKDELMKKARGILNRSKLSNAQIFTLVYDNSTKEFSKRVIKVIEKYFKNNKIGEFTCYNLDLFGRRPLRGLPKEVYNAAAQSDLTIIAIKKRKNDVGEYKRVRKPLLEVAKKRGGRVGAIYDVPSGLFPEIFKYDFERIKAFNLRLYDMLLGKHEVHIKTKAGTDIKLRVDSDKYNLINQDGDLSKPSDQHSLLAGEVYGVPFDAEGKIVVDGSMGGNFSRFNLDEKPLIIDVKKSKIVKHYSDNTELNDMFERYLKKYKFFDRIGELGFGTNVSLKKCYHILGIDEKFPGNHIAFGNPYPKRTGAEWECAVHIDCVMKNCDTWIDGERVLKEGKYVF